MSKQPPAFQFYASDYLASSKVQRMTLEEEGAYIRLLCYNWQDGWVPNDIDRLARLCKTTPKKMAKIWEALQECFGPLPDHPDRLVNPRLEHVRGGLEKYKAGQSNSGRLGAEKRWGRHSEPTNSPIAENSSPSPSSSPSLNTEEGNSPVVPSKPKRTAKHKTNPPDEFEITDGMRAWAYTHGFSDADADRETPAMLDHFRANGDMKQDWLATWRNWMRNSRKFNRSNGNVSKSAERTQRIFATAREVNTWLSGASPDRTEPGDGQSEDCYLLPGPGGPNSN